MMDYEVRYRALERLGAAKKKRTEGVKKGDVILTSEPFAHIINSEYIAMYCDGCIRSCKECLLKPCPECKTIWYCGGGCREEAQAWHRQECVALKRLHTIGATLPENFVRLMARVIFRLRAGGDKYVEKYSERQGRRFRDLMNHYADLKQNEDRISDAEFLMEELKKYIGERFIPNYSDFLGVYGRMLVNRFSFIDKTMLTIGSSMYLSASIFDHACHPNCYISFVGRTVQIRAIVDMPTLDYSKCRISYVDPVSSVTNRRGDLYNKWFFWCECQVCRDKERVAYENSIRCGNQDCQYPVYVPESQETSIHGPWWQHNNNDTETHNTPDKQEENGHHESKPHKPLKTGVENGADIKKRLNITELQKPVLEYALRRKYEEERIQRMKLKEEKKRNLDDLKRRSEERQSHNGEVNGADEESESGQFGLGAGGVCKRCGWVASKDTIKTYQEAVSFTREKLKTMTEENPTLDTLLEILERQGSTFSSINAWRVRTLDFAFNAAMFNGCWMKALEFGEENISGMRYYYGADHPTYSLFLFKVAKGKIYFKEFREGLRLLDEAEPQLNIGLGPSHPINEDLHQVSLMANEDVEICLERRLAAAKKRDEEYKQKQRQQQKARANCRDDATWKLFQVLNTIT